MLERDDGFVGGVKQSTAITEAEEFAFEFEEDVSVNIGDGEVAVRECHNLPYNG